MKLQHRQIQCVWGLLISGLLIGSCAASHAAEITRLRPGFQGLGRVGNVLPVVVEIEGLNANQRVLLQVETADPRGNQVIEQAGAGVAGSEGSLSLTGTFQTGRLDSALRFSVLDAESGAILADRTVSVARGTPGEMNAAETPESSTGSSTTADGADLTLLLHTAHTLLTFGTPAGVREMEASVQKASGREIRFGLLTLDSPRELPVLREALDSVDSMLLTDNFDLNEQQFAVVRDWVFAGGHLLVSSGSTVSSLLETPVGKWLQPYFDVADQPRTIRELTVLQNYVAGARQLQTLSRPVSMAEINSTQIRRVVSALEGVLIARRAIGVGTVTFVAIDVNQRPMNGWPSLDRFYTMLIFDRPQESLTISERRGARISSSGVSDLSTQLATAYDAVPAQDRWSSWQIMALLAVYLLIIGPLDYLLVVHVFRAPHWTWVTFPVLVIAGCGFAWASFDTASPAIVQRQVHLVDMSEGQSEQVVMVRSWTSVSTRETRRAQVAATGSGVLGLSSAGSAAGIRWSGRAEDVYGGMYREGGAGLGRQAYHRQVQDGGEQAAYEGVPMLAGGSQAFVSERQQLVPARSLFESRLSVSGTGLLEGDVVTHLPVTIRNWTVMFGNRVYIPVPNATDEQREIRPGETWDSRDRRVRASDLKAWLNGSRIVVAPQSSKGGIKSDSIQVTTPYNPRSTDPLEIFSMVSLYETAGGQAYVGLSNDTFRRLELSDTIRLNSALLIGTLDEPLADFQIDGDTVAPAATQTVIRILLPVELRKAAPAADLKLDELDDSAAAPAASEASVNASGAPAEPAAQN